MTFTLNIKSAAEIEAAARDRAYAALADYRWQRETGGLTLADGSRVLTTREAQSQISNAVQSISSGLITDPVTWKLASGWAVLGPEQITAMGAAVADHVKRCFEAERDVAAQMDAMGGDLEGFDVQAAFDAAYDARAVEATTPPDT